MLGAYLQRYCLSQTASLCNRSCGSFDQRPDHCLPHFILAFPYRSYSNGSGYYDTHLPIFIPHIQCLKSSSWILVLAMEFFNHNRHLFLHCFSTGTLVLFASRKVVLEKVQYNIFTTINSASSRKHFFRGAPLNHSVTITFARYILDQLKICESDSPAHADSCG